MAAALCCPARAALPLLTLAALATGLDDFQSFMLQAKCTLCHSQGLPFCGETQACGNRSHGCAGSCCTGAFCSVALPDVAESCLQLIPKGVSAITKCAARGLRDCGCYANGGPLEPTTTTTTPRFYCDQGRQRGWSQLKKDWCCRRQGVACTTTLSTSTQSSSTFTTSSRTATTRTGTSTLTGTSRTQTTTGTSATVTTTATTRSTTETFSTATATATRTSVTTTRTTATATTVTETQTSVTSTRTTTRQRVASSVVRTAAATTAASVTTTRTSSASLAATTAPGEEVAETSRSLRRSSTASTSVTSLQAATTLQATTTSHSATAAGAAKLPLGTSSWSTTMGRESAGGDSTAAPSLTSFPSASTAAPSSPRSIRGAFSFAAPGLTLGQVEAASVVALSTQLGVAQDAITVNVVESRRLLAAEPRQLAGNWNVGYTVVVMDSRAGAVAQAATSMAGNVTGFRSVLRDAMVAQGADAATMGSSLQIKSITSVQLKSVPSEGFPSTPSPPSTSARRSSTAQMASSSFSAQSGASKLEGEGEEAPPVTASALPSTTTEFEKKRLPTALVYFFLPVFNAVVITSCCVYCILKKRKAKAAAREKRVSFTPSIEKEQELRESKLRETALPDGTTSLPTTSYPVDLFCEFRESPMASPTANSVKGPPSPIGNNRVSLGNRVSELPSLVDHIPSGCHDYEPPRLFCEEDDALEVQPRALFRQDDIEAHGQCVTCGPSWFLC